MPAYPRVPLASDETGNSQSAYIICRNCTGRTICTGWGCPN